MAIRDPSKVELGVRFPLPAILDKIPLFVVFWIQLFSSGENMTYMALGLIFVIVLVVLAHKKIRGFAIPGTDKSLAIQLLRELRSNEDNYIVNYCFIKSHFGDDLRIIGTTEEELERLFKEITARQDERARVVKEKREQEQKTYYLAGLKIEASSRLKDLREGVITSWPDAYVLDIISIAEEGEFSLEDIGTNEAELEILAPGYKNFATKVNLALQAARARN